MTPQILEFTTLFSAPEGVREFPKNLLFCDARITRLAEPAWSAVISDLPFKIGEDDYGYV